MIIAIDPGKVTGLVLWEPRTPLKCYAHEIDSPVDVAEWVEGALYHSDDDVTVVTEKFTISQRTIKTALSLDALDINGWLTIESQRKPFDLVFQMPSQAKSFATDEKLKALDWYGRTKDGHANDAARHLLVYLLQHEKEIAAEHIVPRLARMFL